MKRCAQEDIAPALSIIVPLFNEIKVVPHLLKSTKKIREAEWVFVDGGSSDGTALWLQKNAPSTLSFYQILQSEQGRAQQMNTGAKASRGRTLLFLHADTRLPASALNVIKKSIHQGYVWGRFDVAFAEIKKHTWVMNCIAYMMNMRSRFSHIATGDQAIFVDKNLFLQAGGFASIALMEDVELCKRFKRISKPYCATEKVLTSARRWQNNGVLKTVLLMWCLRFMYFCGVSPQRLARWYRLSR